MAFTARETVKDSIELKPDEWYAVELDVRRGDRLRVFAAVDTAMDSTFDINLYVLSARHVFEDHYYAEHAYFVAKRVQQVDKTLAINQTEALVVILDNSHSFLTSKDVSFTIEVLTPKRSRREPTQPRKDLGGKETLPLLRRQHLGISVSVWLFVVTSLVIAAAITITIVIICPWALPAVGPFIAIATALANIANGWYHRKSKAAAE